PVVDFAAATLFIGAGGLASQDQCGPDEPPSLDVEPESEDPDNSPPWGSPEGDTVVAVDPGPDDDDDEPLSSDDPDVATGAGPERSSPDVSPPDGPGPPPPPADGAR